MSTKIIIEDTSAEAKTGGLRRDFGSLAYGDIVLCDGKLWRVSLEGHVTYGIQINGTAREWPEWFISHGFVLIDNPNAAEILLAAMPKVKRPDCRELERGAVIVLKGDDDHVWSCKLPSDSDYRWVPFPLDVEMRNAHEINELGFKPVKTLTAEVKKS